MSADAAAGDLLGVEAIRRKALLDERSATLARRGRAEAAVATRSVLLCLCGPDRYGLLLGDVAHIIPARPCTRVPGASAAILGLAALSGRIVSVVRLADAIGRRARETSEPGLVDLAGGHFIILRGADAGFALAVDRVEGVVQIPDERQAAKSGIGPDASGLGSEAVSVYATAGSSSEAIVLVDPRRLLRRYRR